MIFLNFFMNNLIVDRNFLKTLQILKALLSYQLHINRRCGLRDDKHTQ